MTVSIECIPTSELIRITACDLFCRNGYKGVGMRSLAAAVGIHPGSLYAHIESKQALLNELITDYELNLLQIFRSRRVSKVMTSLQVITRLWDDVGDYVSQNRNLALISRIEHGHLSTFQTKRILVVRRRRGQELTKLLFRLPDIALGAQGVREVAEELCTLIECNTNLIVDATSTGNDFVRKRLREMACLLIIKRD